MNRDWTRERWRKQYIREPVQERLWPVVARGIRELLNMLAEDDGRLVANADYPAEAIVTVLAPKPDEIELVRAAVALLIEDGFLELDGRSIRIPTVAAAQAHKGAGQSDAGPSLDAPPKPATSTDRVRRHRARVRERLAAEQASNASSAADSVPNEDAGVSMSVPRSSRETFPSSRGNGKQDPSQEVLERETNNQRDLLPPSRARETRNVSSGTRAAATQRTEEEDEDDADFSVNFSDARRKRALELPIQERAALVLGKPVLARVLHPERWPEIVSVADALAEACGLKGGYLGTYEDDAGVQAVVKLFAAGIPQRSLEFVARTVPRQRWWSENGKRLGLSSLTLEVVRRNLPGPNGRSRVTSPLVANVVASVRQRGDAVAGQSIASSRPLDGRAKSDPTSIAKVIAPLHELEIEGKLDAFGSDCG